MTYKVNNKVKIDNLDEIIYISTIESNPDQNIYDKLSAVTLKTSTRRALIFFKNDGVHHMSTEMYDFSTRYKTVNIYYLGDMSKIEFNDSTPSCITGGAASSDPTFAHHFWRLHFTVGVSCTGQFSRDYIDASQGGVYKGVGYSFDMRNCFVKFKEGTSCTTLMYSNTGTGNSSWENDCIAYCTIDASEIGTLAYYNNAAHQYYKTIIICDNFKASYGGSNILTETVIDGTLTVDNNFTVLPPQVDKEGNLIGPYGGDLSVANASVRNRVFCPYEVEREYKTGDIIRIHDRLYYVNETFLATENIFEDIKKYCINVF